MFLFDPNNPTHNIIGDAHDLAFYVALGFLIAGIGRLLTPHPRGGWLCFAFAANACVVSIGIDAATRSREAAYAEGGSNWPYINGFVLALAVLLVIGTFAMFIGMCVQEHVLRAGLSLVAFAASLVILTEALLLRLSVVTDVWRALAPTSWYLLASAIVAYVVTVLLMGTVRLARRGLAARSDASA